jgi:hypothetical protein
LKNDHVINQSAKTPPKIGVTNVMPAPAHIDETEPSSIFQCNKRKKPYKSSKSPSMSLDALLSVHHGNTYIYMMMSTYTGSIGQTFRCGHA